MASRARMKKRARPPLHLHDAVYAGDVAKIKYCIDTVGVPLTNVDRYGRTPLHLVAVGSSLLEIRMLTILLSTADDEDRADAMSTRDNRGRTPLHVAATYATSTVMDVMLSTYAKGFILADVLEDRTHLKGALWSGNWGKKSAGGELEALDIEHMTPLHLALERLDPNNDEEEDDEDKHPVTEAVRAEAVAMVRLLITRGANVNARDADGRAPIHQAVDAGLPEVAELLLESGADPILGCKAIGMANTALHQAVVRGDEGMVRLLIRASHLDVNTAGQNGLTPLCLAARVPNKEGCARALVEGGADPKAVTTFGKSALEIARTNKRNAILKLFGEEAVA